MSINVATLCNSIDSEIKPISFTPKAVSYTLAISAITRKSKNRNTNLVFFLVDSQCAFFFVFKLCYRRKDGFFLFISVAFLRN